MKSGSIQEEIRQFQEAKQKHIRIQADRMAWRANLKEQMEAELERRVREALDTPPMERMQRVRELARRRADHEAEKWRRNNYTALSDRSSNRNLLQDNRNKPTNSDPFSSDTVTEDKSFLEVNGVDVTATNNPFRYWMRNAAACKRPDNLSGGSVEVEGSADQQLMGCSCLRVSNSSFSGFEKKTVRFHDEFQNPSKFRVGLAAAQNLAILTAREKEILFATFTKEGFKESLKTGAFPDGTISDLQSDGSYKDCYDIVRDNDGPFWPRNYGPLHPKPVHVRTKSTCPSYEPIVDPTDISCEPKKTFDNQTTPYGGQWRGIKIVYDSERSPRLNEPQMVLSGICPNLTFESRFESGNLRQARRIGQFEYELVLSTDLYTKRHTQWYYFRVANAVPGITYKFYLVNFLKRSSLYMEGMKPLFYSEENAQKNGVGWHRLGHHVRYSRNVTHLQCSLLNRDMVYYQMEFQMEFPHADDKCYLAHCYPYTYSDLKEDIANILCDPVRAKCVEKTVMCETRAGNSCFLLTITDSDVDPEEKQGIVVTARVHPGETNASWMMKGFLDHITEPSQSAEALRRNFIFKVIPMLNPDGVIVGNYRCSLAARDLNRNYRHPKSESFPTVFHTKRVVEELSALCPVVLYCDMHGHSRKHNVFMYGCDGQYRDVDNVNTFTPKMPKKEPQNFLEERLFPWLLARQAPEKFNFSGCRFNIRKCKESTGRVVIWRQMMIQNSFTMEATFSGCNMVQDYRRHFNYVDLQEMGKAFGEAVHKYRAVSLNSEERNQTILEIAKSLIKALLESQQRLRKNISDASFQRRLAPVTRILSNNEDASVKVDGETLDDKNEMKLIDKLIDELNLDSMESTFELLEKMNIKMEEEDSGSSDSDSESEPEAPLVEETQSESPNKKKKKKSKKKRDQENKKTKLKENDAVKTISADSKKESSDPKSSTILPSLTNNETKKPKTVNAEETGPTEVQPIVEKQPNRATIKLYSNFVNKYEGRSNGGIPCFSQERMLERANKRLTEHVRSEEERRRMATRYMLDETCNEEIEVLRQRLHDIVHSDRYLTDSDRQMKEDAMQTLRNMSDIEIRELYPLLNQVNNGNGSDDDTIKTHRSQSHPIVQSNYTELCPSDMYSAFLQNSRPLASSTLGGGFILNRANRRFSLSNNRSSGIPQPPFYPSYTNSHLISETPLTPNITTQPFAILHQSLDNHNLPATKTPAASSNYQPLRRQSLKGDSSIRTALKSLENSRRKNAYNS